MIEDISSRLQERMPYFLGAVIGLSFLVLMLVFRSVLVPLKAALLNVLSVGAAYGVVVAVFQWGWGASLIGVHETVPIMPLAPMLMFAILFGLSMDYEVFLLSRVREQYLKHRDPEARGRRGCRLHRPGDHQRGTDHDRVFGAFILAADVVDQDVRRRPGRRRPARRDAGPDGAGPGGDEPARAPGLVAAERGWTACSRTSTSRAATTTSTPSSPSSATRKSASPRSSSPTRPGAAGRSTGRTRAPP